MRLVFYPKGLKDALVKDAANACGLFLACPEDARLKFALSVGKQRRVMEHVFCNHHTRSTGDLCGKAKFCNLDHQIEDRHLPGRDRVLIVLEIIEVELLSKEKAGENVVIRRIDPSAHEELKKVISLPSVDGRTVKMTKTSPKIGPRETEDCQPTNQATDLVRPYTSSKAHRERSSSRERGSSVGRPQSQPVR